MGRIETITVLLVLQTFGWTAPSVATSQGIRFVEQLKAEVLRSQRKHRGQDRRFQRLMLKRLPRYADLADFCRRALTGYYEKLSEPQQREYLGVCQRFFRGRYGRSLTTTTPFSLKDLKEQQLRGHAVAVSGSVRSGRDKWRVGFVLLPTKAGLRIIDLRLDGVSMLRNYRARFRKTVRTKSLAVLLDTLKRAIAKFTR